ncbi:MAG: stage V sporulation T C-terminal domain-containing protein [Bacilli bacterium]|jgi:AbrB family transcriptional regulator (stage V sporulation protein T)|nr:stage V sporulation T C-terminal domain-containing protein [Bacilli bacterium]
MKTTGIVRRIDDLGRVVIPKEIRKTLRIREGENLEITIERDNIILKKHSLMNTLQAIAEKYVESLFPVINGNILITDRDNVIAVGGPSRRKYLDKPISDYLEDVILEREEVFETQTREVEFIPKVTENASYLICPIIMAGDTIGLVIIFSGEKELGELEETIIKIITQLLSKHIEG